MAKSEEDKPPFFKTWQGMYALVLGNLLFMILIFYWITASFR